MAGSFGGQPCDVGRNPLIKAIFSGVEKTEPVQFTRGLKTEAFFGGCQKGWFSKRVVLADVPPERTPERGYIRMFPRNKNRKEGTFACSPGTKTGTRVHSPKPPFYETALLSPSDFCLQKWGFYKQLFSSGA